MTAISVQSLPPAISPLPPSTGAERTESREPVGAEALPKPQVIYNPRFRFDTAANVIVMEFRDFETGEVARSVPSERQLKAYADAQRLPGRDEAPVAVSGSGRGAQGGEDPAPVVAPRPSEPQPPTTVSGAEDRAPGRPAAQAAAGSGDIA